MRTLANLRRLADLDGDGKADLNVFRPSTGTWFNLQSSTSYTTFGMFQWGLPGDIPVSSDYDGDGTTDLAVFRPDSGKWFVRQSSTDFSTSVTYQWGLPGDVPVPGDYDGDGKTDLAVFRPPTGMWYIRPSSTNFTMPVMYQWGLPGDVTSPATTTAMGDRPRRLSSADRHVVCPALDDRLCDLVHVSVGIARRHLGAWRL